MGHCGLHSPGIGWVVKATCGMALQPCWWVNSIFWTQSRQKQKRKFPEQTRKFAEQTRKFTEWSPMWFLVLIRAASGHLLALTCCIYTPSVVHSSCFSRSWLPSSFSSDLMAVQVETLVSWNSVRTKTVLHPIRDTESPLATKTSAYPKENKQIRFCLNKYRVQNIYNLEISR